MRVRLLRLAFRLKAIWSWFFRPVSLGVRMILIQDGKVLLVRHTYMDGWHFPGGAMNRWETPLEGAAREAREEAGVELLEPPTLVEILTSYKGFTSDHVVTYLCRKFRVWQPSDQWEIAERKLFALNELPPDLALTWHTLLHELTQGDEQG
jgi:8-oxo-dGTP pyrophosphatase MutT (NUDIX family)